MKFLDGRSIAAAVILGTLSWSAAWPATQPDGSAGGAAATLQPKVSQASEPPTLNQATAQETASLPDDPDVTLQRQIAAPNAMPSGDNGTAEGVDPLSQGRQTKRILYIVPNFRAVSADETLPPQSMRDKLKTASEDSADYSSFIFIGIQSGLGQMNKSYPEFRQGMAGYGRYYWHTFADATDENLWVEFLIPSALHEDTRYYTLGKGEPMKRFLYSFTRIAITRTDDGNETFNAAEIVGAGAAAGISNFYYPGQERTLVKTYQRWVTNVLIDGGTFVFKEFWPDINNKFFHQKG